MKLALTLQQAFLATIAVISITAYHPAKAVTFDEQEVDPTQVIAIAVPYGENKYNLLVIQQIPGQQQCWSESGSNPVLVEPLLMNFDFTGSCERSTDSNGYSMRINSQDYGLDYLFNIVESNGELLLIGIPRKDPSQPKIIVGRTYGINNGFLKISLNPGWRFTRRSYEGRLLSHVYFSGDGVAINSSVNPVISKTTNPNISPPSNPPSLPSTSPSPQDIREITFTAGDSNYQPLPRLSPVSPLPPVSPLSSPSPVSPLSSPPPLSSPSPLPPVNSNSNSERKSLSDVLGVAPRSLPNGNMGVMPEPQMGSLPNPPTLDSGAENFGRTTSMPDNSQVGRYRVMVAAADRNQQNQVRSLYPDAFPTFYNGQSLMQVGVFSSRDNAEETVQNLNSLGLRSIITQ